MIHFPRPKLAASTAEALLGKVALSDAPNGLFLAAPRRTGKSSFLQRDLVPELEKRGIVTIYVDLWADKGSDPGILIAEAVKAAAQKATSLVAKAARGTKVSASVPGASVTIDVNAINKVVGPTLPSVLQDLAEVTQKPICLIVDEAQHALTTENGANAMAALKSARDQMTGASGNRLMLVMSGSDRDKLLRLVNSNAAPFFGSHISRMPTLGRSFVEHVAKEIERTHHWVAPVPMETLEKAFQLFGFRPQFFVSSINDAITEAMAGAPFEEAIQRIAESAGDEARAQMEATFLALPKLQQVILWAMFKDSASFRPYDAKALRFYREKTGKTITATQAQKALEKLRNRDDPLVWKSARGEYVIEDSGMVRWFENLAQSGKWPP